MQLIRNLPIIRQPRHLILSAEFAEGAHVIDKGVSPEGTNFQSLQYMPLNKIAVIDVLALQALVNCEDELL